MGLMTIEEMQKLLLEKDQQLHEKDLLIKETHHRVKNGLQIIASILRLQMRRVDSSEAKNGFQASVDRILAISAVQDAFARQSGDKIEVREIIDRVSQDVLSSYKKVDQNITCEVVGSDVKISYSKAVPVALIASELVSNAIRHGIKDDNSGSICIIITENQNSTEDQNGIAIAVFDSGRMNPDLGPPDEKKLGLQIVKALVQEQLQGSFSLTEEENQTKAEIIFKK